MELLILQKALVKLVQPVGLVWVLLLSIAIRAWCKREIGTARLLTCLWLGYSMAANPIVGDVLVGTLENRFCHIRPLQMEPLDTIVVLGGGTTATENGDASLTDSGDRVGLAARISGSIKLGLRPVDTPNVMPDAALYCSSAAFGDP